VSQSQPTFNCQKEEGDQKKGKQVWLVLAKWLLTLTYLSSRK
jgi:hypothetical protein